MKRTQDVCYHYPHCTATKIQPVQCTWEKICFWVSNWFVLGLSPVWVPVTVSGCCEQMLTPSFILFVGPAESEGGGERGGLSPSPPDFEGISSHSCFSKHLFNAAWLSDFQTFRRLCLVSKSQLISKTDWRAIDSPKNERTNLICLPWRVKKQTNQIRPFVFLEKLADHNWFRD